MAHFLLTPVGSSGDVHPFIGVGRRLRERGHDVSILTAEPFRSVCERSGLRFVQLHSQVEFDDITKNSDLWHPRKGLRLILRSLASVLRRHYELIASAYEPGRTVLVAHALAFAARVFEDAHHAPAATLDLAPSIFRSDYQQPASIPGVDPSKLPVWVKRSAMWLIDRLLLDPQIVPAINQLRREEGLQPVSRVFNQWLHSPQRVIGMFPEWFAAPQPDWPSQVRLTGFPLYDEADAHDLGADLRSFLDAGSAPLLFTPGTANRAAVSFFAAARDAMKLLQRRALFVTRYRDQLPNELGPAIRHAGVRALLVCVPALRRRRPSRRHWYVRPGACGRRPAGHDAARVRSAGQRDALVASWRGPMGVVLTSFAANASRPSLPHSLTIRASSTNAATGRPWCEAPTRFPRPAGFSSR